MSDSSSSSVVDSAMDLRTPSNSRENVSDRRLLAGRGYFIGEKISSGTFATVRYAEKRTSKSVKKLAVKIIDKSKGSRIFVEKFLPRELAIWPQLRHTHIIQVHQILYIYDRIYAFMELAHRGSVIEYLQEHGAVDENTARIWGKGLCQALRYCHRRGVAHRDIKCDNLLLDNNLQIKIGDFGFCKICHHPESHRRVFSETFCGSAAYVAPEILEGKPYDPIAADVWSAGVCIFVIINNSMPFDDSNIRRMLRDQLRGNWHYSPLLENEPSSAAKKIIAHMMEPKVDYRISLDQVLNSSWMRKS